MSTEEQWPIYDRLAAEHVEHVQLCNRPWGVFVSLNGPERRDGALVKPDKYGMPVAWDIAIRPRDGDGSLYIVDVEVMAFIHEEGYDIEEAYGIPEDAEDFVDGAWYFSGPLDDAVRFIRGHVDRILAEINDVK